MRAFRPIALSLATVAASGGCATLIGLPDGETLGDPFAQSDASGGDASPGLDGGEGSTGDGGAVPVDLSFTPTNLGVRIDGHTAAGDLLFDYDSCNDIDTDRGAAACNSGATFIVLAQDGAPDSAPYPRLGVFVARRIHIAQDVSVHVHGANALVLVATESVEIDGTLTVAGHGASAGPAAWSGIDGYSAQDSSGAGPGAGGGVRHASGGAGGGASYCSAGGRGGESSPGVGGPSGALYGAATISPLLGGSSGGVQSKAMSGAGGGAVQIVANVAVVVGKTGAINAGGGGGTRDCIAGTGGGGSGGAILIEAPRVAIDGVVAANGGAGSSATCSPPGDSPADGLASATPAWDGTTSGAGAAGVTPAQPGGAPMSGEEAGAGGGGAGWIRFNAGSAGAAIATDAIVSPATSTGCATVGTLAARSDAGIGMCAAITASDACATCAAASCCAAAADCVAHEPCATCLATPALMRGPACGTDSRLAAYASCRKTWCPQQCPTDP
jgi:hypothetical protein